MIVGDGLAVGFGGGRFCRLAGGGLAADEIVVSGEILQAVPPEVSQGAKLVLYQDYSHSLASEAPERLVQEVLVFMKELQAAHASP